MPHNRVAGAAPEAGDAVVAAETYHRIAVASAAGG